jgi:hypothetical protein
LALSEKERMSLLKKIVLRIGLSLWAIKTGARLMEYLEGGRKESDAKLFTDALIKPFVETFKKEK